MNAIPAFRIESLAAFGRELGAMPMADAAAAATARARDGQLTKPPGALGRLESLAEWLAAWQGRHPPSLGKPVTLVFAGNHGIAARGVSAFPAEVTRQMVANFAAGGAAINQICRAFGASLKVIDLDLDRPTADFTEGPAMSEAELVAALDAGWQALPSDADVLMVGEMGIGNTTVAATLAAALFGGNGGDWVGRGTGVDDAGLARKARVVDAALACHGAALADPLEALRRVGGRELAAMTGAMAAARRRRVPVILDGFVAGAAAAVLYRIAPGLLGHCVAGHVSAEPGHRLLLERIGQKPLLDLGMRLGEASGAAVALALLQAALATHAGMATFGEAGVAGKI